jgi:hypothetical protein
VDRCPAVDDQTPSEPTYQPTGPLPDHADTAPRWQCSGCANWYHTDLSCELCEICEHCEATVTRVETITAIDGSSICPSCQDSYYRCEGCDGWNRDGDECGNGCDDSDDCGPEACSCGECRDEASDGLVYSYSYKPRPIFHGKGPLFLGPEIEIQTPYGGDEECVQLATRYLGELGYLKADSSIGHGFEIVTHPMSYEWALANFPWQMLTDLAELGCAATDSTGIHVHVSRAGFASDCHTYRWMKFIYRNQAQVTTLARRYSADWAAFTDDDRRAVKHYAKGGRSHRYRAINTNNTDTFELRIFASSLEPAEVQAALGFAAASVEYTRHLNAHSIAHRGGWAWPAFVTWLSGQPTYQALTEQLEALSCVC